MTDPCSDVDLLVCHRLLLIADPARVSRLTKGKWQDFSLDMLLTLAARAGLHPKLRLAA